MVFDLGAKNYPWFKTRTAAVRLFGYDLSRTSAHHFNFQYMPTIQAVGDLSPGILHGGASIAGCAIQFAHLVGCDRITLLGIDQFGDRHFDGTIGAPKHYGKPWSTIKPLEKVIRIVNARGSTVDSLSKTKLSIPHITVVT
jgi:hypothetical protein